MSYGQKGAGFEPSRIQTDGEKGKTGSPAGRGAAWKAMGTAPGSAAYAGLPRKTNQAQQGCWGQRTPHSMRQSLRVWLQDVSRGLPVPEGRREPRPRLHQLRLLRLGLPGALPPDDAGLLGAPLPAGACVLGPAEGHQEWAQDPAPGPRLSLPEWLQQLRRVRGQGTLASEGWGLSKQRNSLSADDQVPIPWTFCSVSGTM